MIAVQWRAGAGDDGCASDFHPWRNTRAEANRDALSLLRTDPYLDCVSPYDRVEIERRAGSVVVCHEVTL